MIFNTFEKLLSLNKQINFFTLAIIFKTPKIKLIVFKLTIPPSC